MVSRSVSSHFVFNAVYKLFITIEVTDLLFLRSRFSSLKQVFCLKVSSPTPQRTNFQLQMKIKLLSILINIVIHRLIILHYEKTEHLIDNIIADDLNPLHDITH